MAEEPLASGIALPASIRFVEVPLPHLDVTTPLATAQIYLHGAHVARWQPAHSAEPVLFMSRHSFLEAGKPIRGGVPICFPWFGGHPTDSDAPAHGFARLVQWTLDEVFDRSGTVAVTLSLRGDRQRFAPRWPRAFLITHRISISSRLTMTLDVRNEDDEPFTYSEALHTYLAVAGIEEVAIDGLEDTEYVDKMDGFARKAPRKEPIRFTGDTDRVYLEATSRCVVHDRGNRRQIVVDKKGSHSTVVWNPWVEKAHALPDFGDDEWRNMVCVETANVGDASIHLAPGDSHAMRAEISVDVDRESRVRG